MGNITDGDNVALALQVGWLLTALLTALVGACVWLESWWTWRAVVRRGVRDGRRTLALLSLRSDSAILLMLSVIAANGLLATSARVADWPGQWGADYLRPSLLIVALLVVLYSRIQVMFGRRRLQREGLERFDREEEGGATHDDSTR